MESFSSLSGKSGVPAQATQTAFHPVRRSSPGPLFIRLLVTIPIFGLVMEWLVPLQGMGGDDGPMMLETLSILACFILFQGLFTIQGWLWFPLNACALLLLWGRLFGSMDVFSWLSRYVIDIFPNDVNVFRTSWLFSDLSDETRALVLLLGWGIMVSAVHMLSLYRRTVWLFGGTTVVYLALMEAGTERPVYDDMFRTTCFILMAQGLMLLLRLKGEELPESGPAFRGQSKPSIKAILSWSLCVLVLSAALTGLLRLGGEFVAARSGSGITVSDMADKIQEWSSEMSSRDAPAGNAGLTGYDSLAQEMGGPLTLGKGLFFTGESPVPAYWRGESLHYYDGRRWIAERTLGSQVEIDEDLSSMQSFQTGSPNEQVVQKITLEAPPSAGLPLFSGGTITRIIGVNGLDGKELEPAINADPESGSLRFEEEDLRVFSYILETTLQAPKDRLQLSSIKSDPEHIAKTYLQLPDALPQRVRDLGEEMTAGASGRYETVTAVESYLEREYTYTLKTKIPPAGMDFTDHFLFGAKEGYCTHFATAMVVLLRSQGVPARYVMGFAPGEKMAGTKQSYRVTQEEAHAWVEVYFPGEGWAAFDPTPGFNAGFEGAAEGGTTTGQMIHNPWRFMEMMQTMADSARGWLAGLQPMTAAVLILMLLPVFIVAAAALARWKALSFNNQPAALKVTERDKLTAVSARAWRKLEKRYGVMEPGITVKKYIQSLNIQDEALRSEIELFASRWERAAYKEEPLSRSEKALYLRQCRTIVKKRV